MPPATRSDDEPDVNVETVTDLERFIDDSEACCRLPVAVSVTAHGHRADLLVGHVKSFVHLSPEAVGEPYYVTVGEPAEGHVDFWLHSNHHTQFESRHLVDKAAARAAFVEFFATGRRSASVLWESYDA
jgi:hypothetical protein